MEENKEKKITNEDKIREFFKLVEEYTSDVSDG